jgi:hypothetical protein
VLPCIQLRWDFSARNMRHILVPLCPAARRLKGGLVSVRVTWHQSLGMTLHLSWIAKDIPIDSVADVAADSDAIAIDQCLLSS